MATSHQRKPDAATAERQAEAVAKAQAEKAQADLAREARRASEKAEDGQEISQDAAAQLQRGLGNSAVAAMLKKGSDTDTSTSSAEATQDEKQEEDKDEGEDIEAELERALPSFSTGGGGAGGGGASAPWAVGHLFGGDDDADDELLELFQPRWRPMAPVADPDEDVPLDGAADGAAAPEDDAPLAWDEADAALGSAAWTPDVLSRGLRHARRLARPGFEPESLADDTVGVWARGRALLRWLGSFADDACARALALAALGTGVPDGLGHSGAVALQLAQAEAIFALLRPTQARVADAALDRHTRGVVERRATEMLERGSLAGPRLLAGVVGALPEVEELPEVDEVHPGALDAVQSAAWLAPIPIVDVWRTPAGQAELDAIDRVLRAFTGASEEPAADPPLAPRDVRVLFLSIEALLTAIGGVQVELVGAAATIWPYAAPGRVTGLVTELDQSLRAAARRVLRVGQALETRLGTHEREDVERLSREAVALRDAVEAARNQALRVLAHLLDPEGGAPAPDALPGLEEALRSKWVDAARAIVAHDTPGAIHATSAGVRLDGAPAWADRCRALSASPGLPIALQRGLRLQALAGALLAGDVPGAARDAAQVERLEPGPYARVLCAIVRAAATGELTTLRVGGLDHEGGALNLLKARWVEVRAA